MSSKESSVSTEAPTGAYSVKGKRWFKDELLPMVGSGKEILPGHGLHVRDNRKRRKIMQVQPYPVLSARTHSNNPDHHLWNNNGTWYLCCTVLTSPITANRIRTSLKTHSLATARSRRDRILAELSQKEVAA
jgi:hypothetical protein